MGVGRCVGVQMSWTRQAVKRHRGEGCRGTDAQIRGYQESSGPFRYLPDVRALLSHASKSDPPH